jgi:ParB family chromosome partitioning protein
MQKLFAELPSENVMAKAELEQTRLIPISQIELRKLQQPRRYFDPEALEKLTESIRAHGILQPLVVRAVLGVTARYELVVGERRLRAARAAGMETVLVVVRELNDIEAATLTLVENLQRQDLNAIEQTEGILALLALHLQLTPEETTSRLVRMAKEVKGQTAQNVLGQCEIETVTSVFDSLGLISWESFVSSRLPLLNLPQELQQAIQTQGLDYTKAIALSRLKDDKQRSIVLKQVLSQNWSVRQIQAQIKLLRHSESPEKPSFELFTATSDLKTDKSDNSCAEAAGAATNETLKPERSTTMETETSRSAEPGTESEFDRTVPLLRVVEPQEFQALSDQEPLYRQLNLFNQIETISRKAMDLLKKRRKPINDAKKQSRLEALLAELNQILGEEL